MDEDSNFDYEMDPTTGSAELLGGAEEMMDDARSDGMIMSDAVVYSDSIDKGGIDVDFQDSASTQGEHTALAPASTTAEPIVTYVEDEHVNGHFGGYQYTAETVQGADVGQGTEAQHQELFETSEGTPPSFNSVARKQEPPTATVAVETSGLAETQDEHQQLAEHGYRLEFDTAEQEGRDESDESKGKKLLAVPQGAESTTTISTEYDQLAGDPAEAPHENGEDHDAQGDAYYGSEVHEVPTVRVSFNGQEFVMWSQSDIPAYFAPHDKGEESVETNKESEAIEVEAPALDVQQDVLWQPLDGFFSSLREKKALGDFLEESYELHLVFPDLDLDVFEDNLYCRDITLEDLYQLHHGLGLASSLHVQVFERPRFITKYNELAQHVAGILGNHLQHSGEDSEEEEQAWNEIQRNGSHPKTDTSRDLVGVQSSKQTQASVTEQVGQSEPSEHPDDHLLVSKNSENNDQSAKAATPDLEQGENYGVPEQQHVTANEGDFRQQEGTEEESSAEHHRQQLQLTHDKNSGDSNDAQDFTDDAHDELEPQGGGEQASEDEGDELGDDEVGRWEEEEVDQEGDQEGDAGSPEEEEVGADDDADADEGDYEVGIGEEVDELGGDGSHDAAEQDYDADPDPDAVDQEYEEESGDYGADGEQTFYTTVNDGSDGEVDELEEPGEGWVVAKGEQGEPPVDHQEEPDEATYEYEAEANDELAWQEGTDEQVIEYTEEQGNSINYESHSSTASALHQSGIQRKRRPVEDDDAEQYEEDDHEAESKRAKVD